MPSARQIAKGLRQRGVTAQARGAINWMCGAVQDGQTAEEVAKVLREGCTSGELRAVQETIAGILTVIDDIERTHVPSRALTATDVRRRTTREELTSEQ